MVCQGDGGIVREVGFIKTVTLIICALRAHIKYVKKCVLIFLFAVLAALSLCCAPPPDNRSVTFEVDGVFATYKHEKITPTDFTVKEEIERRKINGTREEQLELIDRILQSGGSLRDAVDTCFPLFIRTAKDLAKRVKIAPVNSVIAYDGEKYTVKPSKSGVELSLGSIYVGFYDAIKSGKTHVKLNSSVQNAEVTEEYNRSILCERASYETSYVSSSDNRKSNIILALSKINGAVIEDGESLSFNEVVGSRTIENGFKMSKIIVAGKYVEGVGGGVCQASTCLYNAALLGGLDCKASNHSIMPSYVEPSFDAMVNSYSSDLVITNNTGEPVRILCKSEGGVSRVTVYGLKYKYTVKRAYCIERVDEAKEVVIKDAEKKYVDDSGESVRVSYPINGGVSSGYLEYYLDGRLVKRSFIRRDTYYAVDGITAVP